MPQGANEEPGNWLTCCEYYPVIQCSTHHRGADLPKVLQLIESASVSWIHWEKFF